MPLKTLVSYLLGSRTAILQFASHRGTIWLGLLFVISAGFAREYDGEDLLHEPWHLFLPLIASFSTSMLLFGLIYLLSLRRHAGTGNFVSAYRVFLSLYWMTAPLAWLYAIPVERFMSAADAVSVNLWLLALVSIWRVILITRVIEVVFNASLATVFPVVMLFADTVAITLTQLVSVPLMGIMGGVRLTESESIIAGTTLLVMVLAVYSFRIWLIGTIYVFVSSEPRWKWASDLRPSGRIRRSVWLAAIAANLVWVLILPKPQREQQLRFQVEQRLRHGQLSDALDVMTAHRLNEFPPHWDPPPHSTRGDTTPSLVDLTSLVVERDDDWVRQFILKKFRHKFEGYRLAAALKQMSNDDRLKMLDILERFPERNDILFDDLTSSDKRFGLRSELREFLEFATDKWQRASISDEVRAKTEKLIQDLSDTKESAQPGTQNRF